MPDLPQPALDSGTAHPQRSVGAAEISELVLETTESLFAKTPGRAARHRLRSADYTVPCSNPMCEGGGLPVEEVVKPLLEKHETRRRYSVPCRGTERFQDGKAGVSRLCMNRFEGTVEVIYRR